MGHEVEADVASSVPARRWVAAGDVHTAALSTAMRKVQLLLQVPCLVTLAIISLHAILSFAARCHWLVFQAIYLNYQFILLTACL